MQLSEESQQVSPQRVLPKAEKGVMPLTSLAVIRSYSEDAIDFPVSSSDIETAIKSNSKSNKLLKIDSRHKPYYSENEWEYDFSEGPEQDEQDGSDQDEDEAIILKQKRYKSVQRANSSDLNAMINKLHGSNKRKKVVLDDLSRDALKSEYLKERKQRIRHKKKYKRMSKKVHDIITKTADDYEDQLKQNEDDLKQEYEAKLIEAAIQHNESQSQINELTQEIQRLQAMLVHQAANPAHSRQQSITTDNSAIDTASIGPINHPSNTTSNTQHNIPNINIPTPNMVTITSPAIHSMHSNYSNNNNNNSNRNMHHMATPHSRQDTPFDTPQGTPMFASNISTLSGTTPIAAMASSSSFPFNVTQNMPTPLEKKSLSDEGISIHSHDNNSMEDKLRMAMSPSLKFPANQYIGNYNDIITLHDPLQHNHSPEGSDDDMDTGIVFNPSYNNNNNKNESESSSSSESSSPSPSPEPKKKKKKKRKKQKEESSFWDVLVKCITPTVCEAEQ